MIREKMQTSFRLFMEIGVIICNNWVQKLAFHLLTVQNVNGPLHRLSFVKLLTSQRSWSMYMYVLKFSLRGLQGLMGKSYRYLHPLDLPQSFLLCGNRSLLKSIAGEDQHIDLDPWPFCVSSTVLWRSKKTQEEAICPLLLWQLSNKIVIRYKSLILASKATIFCFSQSSSSSLLMKSVVPLVCVLSQQHSWCHLVFHALRNQSAMVA